MMINGEIGIFLQLKSLRSFMKFSAVFACIPSAHSAIIAFFALIGEAEDCFWLTLERLTNFIAESQFSAPHFARPKRLAQEGTTI
jgi:hypothetical protein